MAGDHHHGQVGPDLLGLLQCLQAVLARQPDIEQHELDALAIGVVEQVDGLLATLGLHHVVALVLEGLAQGPPDARLVIHQEDGRGDSHGSMLGMEQAFVQQPIT